MYNTPPPHQRRGRMLALVAFISIVIIVLEWGPGVKRLLRSESPIRISGGIEQSQSLAAVPIIPISGDCVDIVDSIGAGVPTSGTSWNERVRKRLGERMVLAAQFNVGTHSEGSDVEGVYMSPVRLAQAMEYVGSGFFPYREDDIYHYFGAYQKFNWYNPDPEKPKVEFYHGHLDKDSLPSFKVGQVYPAGTIIGYLTDGGPRAKSPKGDGTWIYIHTHIQLIEGGILIDLEDWWRENC